MKQQGAQKQKKRFGHAVKSIKRCWQLYVLMLPALLYLLIFAYAPMAGVQIAFRDFKFSQGIWGSNWVGLKHFKTFFESIQFSALIKNTLRISLTSLVCGFPLPIFLALLLNECTYKKLKKTVQTLTYAPYFISTVVLVSMLNIFLSESTGLFNNVIRFLGGEGYNFMGSEKTFVPVYVLSGMWQGAGWGSIIYLAALSGVDPQLHEAAEIDGANKLQRIWHVSLPSVLPTIAIMLIMSCGSILSVGYEKVYLMQNTLNQSVSEVISTYVYKIGLVKSQYSYTAAIGLANSVVNVIMLVIVNKIAKRVSEVSLF